MIGFNSKMISMVVAAFWVVLSSASGESSFVEAVLYLKSHITNAFVKCIDQSFFAINIS